MPCAGSTGVGLTVTVKLKEYKVPVHWLEAMVTVYTAVTALVVVLVRSSFIDVCADCAPVLPEKPVPVGAAHE
jgi:hypothetical protein